MVKLDIPSHLCTYYSGLSGLSISCMVLQGGWGGDLNRINLCLKNIVKQTNIIICPNSFNQRQTSLWAQYGYDLYEKGAI